MTLAFIILSLILPFQPPPRVYPITLSVEYSSSTAVLTWSGGMPSQVATIYRDGVYLVTTENDGQYTDRLPTGTLSANYRVCIPDAPWCSK